MERRARLALLAAVAVLLAAVGCLATTWSGGPSASTATVVRPSAEVRGVGPEAVALLLASRVDPVGRPRRPPSAPWLVGLATVGLVWRPAATPPGGPSRCGPGSPAARRAPLGAVERLPGGADPRPRRRPPSAATLTATRRCPLTDHDPPTRSRPDLAATRLPGVGHRLDLRDEDGATVSVIRRKDGTLELHHEHGLTILGPVEARSACSPPATSWPDPSCWSAPPRCSAGSSSTGSPCPPAPGRSGARSRKLAVRRRTGVTIVAILRGSVPVVDPDPEQRIEAGDELVVAGRAQDRDALERFLVEGG
ncbi:MAG: TrkA C-terminal domain-containing protein [Acidimicrobiales bacterium]